MSIVDPAGPSGAAAVDVSNICARRLRPFVPVPLLATAVVLLAGGVAEANLNSLPPMVIGWCALVAFALPWAQRVGKDRWTTAVLAVQAVLAVAIVGAGIGPPVAPIVVIAGGLVAFSLPLRVALVLFTVQLFTAVILVATQSVVVGPMVWFVLPSSLAFWLGRMLRSAVVDHARADTMSRRLLSLNTALREAAPVADQLAAARERAAFAEELHHALGQGLTTSHIQIESALRALDTGRAPEALSALGEAISSNETALAELRRCVAVLRDPDSRRSLGDILRDLGGSEVHLEVVVQGEERRLGGEVEFAVFRVVSEAIATLASSQATRSLIVRLDYEGSRLRLTLATSAGTSVAFTGPCLAELRRQLEMVSARLTTPVEGEPLRVDVELALS